MIEFYKPNKNNTGFALRVNVFVKKRTKADKGLKAVFLNFVKQTGFSEGGKGTFYGGEECRIKLTSTEIAGILHHIRSNTTFSAYHTNPQGSSTLTVEPYFKKIQTDKGWEPTGDQKGFVLKSTKTVDNVKATFGIALTFEESRLLTEYLKYSLTHIFNTSYAEGIDSAKERRNNQQNPPDDSGQLESTEDASF